MFNKRRKYLYPITVIAILLLLCCSPLLGQNGKNNSGSSGTDIPVESYEEYNTISIPASLLKLHDLSPQYFVIVGKKEQQLRIYKYDGQYHLVRSFKCSTGRNPGMKEVNGDQKTPVGIYFFTKILEPSDLNRMYGKYVAAQFGIRAFDTNYPNPFDRVHNRQGYGIWLHGTDEPERAELPNSTRGCVVMRNSDIETVSQFVRLNETPIIITEELKMTNLGQLNAASGEVQTFLKKWSASWEQRDFVSYQSCYSDNFRYNGRNLGSWIEFKKDILDNYEWVSIDISDVRIFHGDNYYYVEFFQEFQTDLYSDTGIKKLYLIEENGNFTIVNENWESK